MAPAGEFGLAEKPLELVESLIKDAKLEVHITMPGFVLRKDLPNIYYVFGRTILLSLEKRSERIGIGTHKPENADLVSTVRCQIHNITSSSGANGSNIFDHGTKS